MREHAISYCPIPLPENAADMEHRAFLGSQNKNQYFSKVRKIIDDIDKKTMSKKFVKTKKEYRNGLRNGNEEVAGCSRSNSHANEKALHGNERLLKSRLLVLKSRRYLRKHHDSPLQSLCAIKRKKNLLSRFRMHKYLSSLISVEEDLIVDKIRSDAALPNAQTSIESVHAMGNNWKSKICSFYAELDEMDREPIIPQYICDPITSDIFTDPVVAQSGITYERSVIQKYMQHAEYDPITHARFTSDVLIPNRTLQEVVQGFLTENEWALSSDSE